MLSAARTPRDSVLAGLLRRSAVLVQDATDRSARLGARSNAVASDRELVFGPPLALTRPCVAVASLPRTGARALRRGATAQGCVLPTAAVELAGGAAAQPFF